MGKDHDDFATPIGDIVCASLIPGYACAKIQSNVDGDPGGCDVKCCITGALCPHIWPHVGLSRLPRSCPTSSPD